MALTATEILNAQDAQVIPLEVPEWNGSVFIRTLTGAERDRLEIMFKNMGGGSGDGATVKSWRAEFASLVISDESGNRIFDDKQIEELAKKNGKVLDRITDAGLNHNGLTEGAIEEAEKN